MEIQNRNQKAKVKKHMTQKVTKRLVVNPYTRSRRPKAPKSACFRNSFNKPDSDLSKDWSLEFGDGAWG